MSSTGSQPDVLGGDIETGPRGGVDTEALMVGFAARHCRRLQSHPHSPARNGNIGRRNITPSGGLS